MKEVLIGQVKTDPLIPYGGIFNIFECQIILSSLSLLLFLPLIRDGRFKNFLLFIFTILPILNIFYRNTHPFIGGVFLGHLLLIVGIFICVYLMFSGFDTYRPHQMGINVDRKILSLLVISIFALRAILIFGSRPTDSGIFSAAGGILYAGGSSMFRDYWGVVSIGARYGPALYLSYLPFVPIAHITKYLLWGDALSSWDSIADVPLSVATAYTGALFYEALIIVILIKSFKRYGVYAAIIYLLNPLNSLIVSVNANELPQTAFFLLGLFLIRRPVVSALSLVFSSMIKVYPIIGIIPFVIQHREGLKKRFLSAAFLFAIIFFSYWLYEASLAPAELRTNPLRDILLYQRSPGDAHSIWYFADTLIYKNISLLILTIILLLVIYISHRIIKEDQRDFKTALRISIILFCTVVFINQSVHPGYYYFIQTLIFYLFFYDIEKAQQNPPES